MATDAPPVPLTEAPVAEQQAESTPFGVRHYFLIRRLHSLAGLVPVGVFVFVHLLTNASILGAPDGSEFQKSVERIHALGPLLVPVEILFIFIPLLFHALLGVQIWLTSQPNTQHYRYGPNIRYTLQRITGVIAFLFIIYHVWQMHWFGAGMGGGRFALHDGAGNPTAAASTAAAIQAGWWIAPLYAVGIVASVFHLANGVWTSLITWGITIRPRTQQVSAYCCAAFGVVLALVGLGALSGFRSFPSAPRPTETQHAVSTRSGSH